MNTKEVRKFKMKLFFFLALINLIIIICTYNIMPVIFNYPPYAESNLEFQNDIEPLNHVQQYIIIFIILTVIFIFITNILMNNIYHFMNKYYRKKTITDKEIKKIRKDCYNIPYIFYISEIIVIWSVGIVSSIALGISNIIILKFSLLLITIISLISLLQFMFLQRNLKKISILTFNGTQKFEKNSGFRIKFSTNLIIQIMPFLLASIIVISLVGYAKTTEEKGNSIMNYYKVYLDNKEFKNVNLEALKSELDTIQPLTENDYYVIIPPEKENCYTSNPNAKVTDFFTKYLEYFFYDTNGMIYEYYGTEQQAYMIEIKDENNEIWYVGFEYSITDYPLLYFYLEIIIVVSLLYFAFIYLWSRNTSENISQISKSLEHIVEENDYTAPKFLPIFSNDEFGDLAYSYNQIEVLTNLHLKEIQNNQEMLVEQERLASLGQLIGGIAHNLKTPIFSVAGGLEGLSDLINEFDESIESPAVTDDDMHEIANDMREWITKLKGHISYMSEVITAVKGQTVTLSENVSMDFSITELFKRVDILMKHEIKNALATLEITNNIGNEDILTGNINSLVQIINNIISNALEAYGNDYTNKKVELEANIVDGKVIITIRDYGPGISEVAQEKLFKEMITTKGKNGTGLGMFMSYSNIKAHFSGNLTYDTVIGQGTTFYITLPILGNTDLN